MIHFIEIGALVIAVDCSARLAGLALMSEPEDTLVRVTGEDRTKIHGTLWGYARGCRCGPCATTRRTYVAERRHARRAARAAEAA